jgi:hypothetical protein
MNVSQGIKHLTFLYPMIRVPIRLKSNNLFAAKFFFLFSRLKLSIKSKLTFNAMAFGTTENIRLL